MSTRQYDNFNDLVTFTRSSGGTALRPISYGPELVTNGTFDTDLSGWTEDASGVVTWSDGVALVGNGNGVSNTYFSQTVSAVSGKTYEIKVGVNLLSGAGVRIILDGVNQGGGEYFTSDQTFYYTATSSTIDVEIYRFRNHTGSVEIDNISVKEVLFDQAGAPLTLFNHLTDTPRIEYDADGNVLGLLIEESRTNLITYSEDFTDASWIASGSDVSGSAEGPDGVSNSAAILVDDGGGGIISAYLRTDVTVLTATAYTASVFAKADQLGWIAIYARNFTTPANGQVFFDLNNGTVGTESVGISGQIEDFGNGWYRCSITFTTDAADTTGSIRIYPAEADNDSIVDRDGTSSILIYGAQLEAGAFPTSYIPTSGATATRSADVASIPVADFGYNQSEGTVFVEASSYKGIPKLLHLNDGSDSNRAQITASASNVAGYVQATGDSGSFISVAGAPTVPFKAALGIETNDMGLTVNGGSVSTDTSQNVPVSITKLNIGSDSTGASVGQVHIKSIKYYPRRLTNAQLQELTT